MMTGFDLFAFALFTTQVVSQSQGQQDGLIKSVLTLIGETNRYYAEIG